MLKSETVVWRIPFRKRKGFDKPQGKADPAGSFGIHGWNGAQGTKSLIAGDRKRPNSAVKTGFDSKLRA